MSAGRHEPAVAANVAYLIDTMACDTAGTQKQLLETIRRLDRTRYNPLLVCLWESPWMRTADLPCETVSLGHRGFLKPGFPGVVRRLACLYDERGIDLVQVFFDEAIFVGWMGALQARRRPVLVSSRRDMGLGAANQPWYHRLFPLALPLVNRDFAAILANSEMVKLHAARRERTATSRYRVVRNGVAFPPPAVSGQTAPVAAGGVGVACVASLTPVKRHDVLLRAWARLPRTGDSGAPHLYLLGDGPERARLEALAAELGLDGTVTFAGAVTDVVAWLRSVDVGVLCSDREGLSNAILEYMACGLPVVATAVGGNPELVDAGNGVLVPPGDDAALGVALAHLVADEGERRRLGGASLGRIRDNYAWDRAMSSLMDCYDDLLGIAPCVKTGSSA
jgi:glycosyltransferase involved in cell wall biosynthesis